LLFIKRNAQFKMLLLSCEASNKRKILFLPWNSLNNKAKKILSVPFVFSSSTSAGFLWNIVKLQHICSYIVDNTLHLHVGTWKSNMVPLKWKKRRQYDHIITTSTSTSTTTTTTTININYIVPCRRYLLGITDSATQSFTLFISFRLPRLHRRYYTTVELDLLELANSRTVDSRSLELLYSLTGYSLRLTRRILRLP
jgi:hypothetical protein